jgi:tRNA (cytidine/uridine-2'-O-)-methyltransferase
MFNVVLYEPEIPPNTGNIIRLCANTGARLHLIEPLGFDLDEASVRRAGLDYRHVAEVRRYADWACFLESHAKMRLWALSTRGGRIYSEASFRPGDGLLFGPETRGLPGPLLAEMEADAVLRLPMIEGSRSINLANTVAATLYEALRQNGHGGLS